jgi:hypothetical protein
VPFGQQRPVSAESSEWQVRLTGWHPTKWPPQQFRLEVKNKNSGSVSQLALNAWGGATGQALELNQIDEMGIFENKLLILGRASANSSEADILELPSGKALDRFPCFMPVVSPDNQFVGFLKSFPGHPGPVSVSAEYLIYSLAHIPTGSSPVRAVYPPGATNAPDSNLVPGLDSPVHWISSEHLFWLDAQTLAFADRYQGEQHVVVVDLSHGIPAPIVRTETINLGDLIDLENCRKQYSPGDFTNVSRDPSSLVHVQGISHVLQSPGYLCLRFQASPCLARTELTVQAP